MKKMMSAILIVMMFCSAFTVSASADFKDQLNSYRSSSSESGDIDKSNLPSIDEVLAGMTTDSGRIEVRDDLNDYDPDNFGENDYGQFKLIILERYLPEKEFTEFDSGYPDSYVDDLPDDFTGVDIGSSRIWVRCDLMNQVPRELIASSMADADIIIVGETQYFRCGTISYSTYSGSDDGELPEFETIDEMLEYLQQHQPVIEKIFYYPKFGAYSLIDLYSTTTKQCEVYNYKESYPKRFASNPEASDKLEDMKSLANLIGVLSTEEADIETSDSYLSYLKDVIPQTKIDFWQTCIDTEEYRAAASSMEEQFWVMAAELMDRDPNEEHKENYRLVIEDRNVEALVALADFCNYSGFDTPIETIRDSKEYLAVPDYEWVEANLNNLVAEFN